MLKSFLQEEKATLTLKAVKVIMNAIFILGVFFLNERFWMACFMWVEFPIRCPCDCPQNQIAQHEENT